MVILRITIPIQMRCNRRKIHETTLSQIRVIEVQHDEKGAAGTVLSRSIFPAGAERDLRRKSTRRASGIQSKVSR